MAKGKKIGKTWSKRIRCIDGEMRWVKVRKVNGKEQIKRLKFVKRKKWM
jgi:hypothetical protein